MVLVEAIHLFAIAFPVANYTMLFDPTLFSTSSLTTSSPGFKAITNLYSGDPFARASWPSSVSSILSDSRLFNYTY